MRKTSEDRIEVIKMEIQTLEEEIKRIKTEIPKDQIETRREMIGELRNQQSELRKEMSDLKKQLKVNKIAREQEELERRMVEDIKKASQTYTTINYKRLAKMLGYKSQLLLRKITDMITSNELRAVVHLPFIKFRVAPAVSSHTPPGPPCPICKRPSTFIPQYSRYYCYPCQKYLPKP